MGRLETIQALVDENCVYLNQLSTLVDSIDDEEFVRQEHPYAGGGIGKHTRHICDFYRAFVAPDGDLVDYDKRRRDPDVESNRGRARSEIGRLVAELQSTRSRAPQSTLRVRYEGAAEDAIAVSSPDRELAFLASHTVHHFALIAMIARLQGRSVPETFGIAPSTIRHLQGTKSERHPLPGGGATGNAVVDGAGHVRAAGGSEAGGGATGETVADDNSDGRSRRGV